MPIGRVIFNNGRDIPVTALIFWIKKLAYLKYDSISKRRLTCEISTGKFIVELEGRSDGTYWKYYIEEDGCHYIYFNKTKGSPCVQITREEFDALNIKPGTHHAYDANRRRYEY